MTCTIRRGAEADIPALIAIERDAAQSYRSIGYDFCADGEVRDENEHKRGLNEGATFVAENTTGKLAGFILLWVIDGHAHITELSVSQEFQKQGIGQKLITAGEKWARDEGYEAITLTTFTEVSWNAPFYRRIGYEEFTPSSGDPELIAAQKFEAFHGFAAKPRIAMKKQLA